MTNANFDAIGRSPLYGESIKRANIEQHTPIAEMFKPRVVPNVGDMSPSRVPSFMRNPSINNQDMQNDFFNMLGGSVTN